MTSPSHRRPSWELPTIVSVDDHVVEPPHVWETLAARSASATGAPRSSAAASAT